jgi:protein-tyrosine phosphatase
VPPEAAVHFEQRLEELKAAATGHGLNVELGLASEIMLGSDLQRVISMSCGTYNGKGEYFLVEFPKETPHEIILNVVKSARRWNKRPVVAHVERYSRVVTSPERPAELKTAGAILTLDAGSLFGQFGGVIQKRAKALMQLDAIDILTSDAHDDADHGFCMKKGATIVASILGEARVNELVLENPRRVWNGEPWPDESTES